MLLNTYFASRNRLENNSDHWNALLISLRELAEWAIAKEAELESMGPIGGDELSIRRQQESARSFSRQLEDKRAVIENNLLTGRQHLDSVNVQAEEGNVQQRAKQTDFLPPYDVKLVVFKECDVC